MTIKIDPSGLKQTKWHEYAPAVCRRRHHNSSRRHGGPKVGSRGRRAFSGLPAVFPASATLIEKHERKRKQKRGMNGGQRGTDAAALDALGAAMGSIGLVAFAGVCWWLIPRFAASLALAGATFFWMLISCSIWSIRQRRRRFF
jgi:uncharacterized membrane protein (GlpM family)